MSGRTLIIKGPTAMYFSQLGKKQKNMKRRYIVNYETDGTISGHEITTSILADSFEEAFQVAMKGFERFGLDAKKWVISSISKMKKGDE